MSLLDILSQMNTGMDGGGDVAPNVPAGLMSLLGGGAPPQATAPMTSPASPTGLPPASPVDNSMVLPLMLMRAAMDVSARRAPGQSQGNQNFTAAYNALLTGMDTKAQNEESWRKNELAKAEMGRTNEAVSASQQARAQAAETHPLEVAAKKYGLSKAELETRLKEKELSVFDEVKASKLALEAAQTEAQKAAASARVTAAEAALTRAQAAMNELGIKSALLDLRTEQANAAIAAKERSAPKPFQTPDGKSGTTWMEGGKSYIQFHPMDEVSASKTVLKQIEARKRLAQETGSNYTPPTPEQVQAQMLDLMRPKPMLLSAGASETSTPKSATEPSANKSTAGADTQVYPGVSAEHLKDMMDKVSKLKPGQGYEDDQGRIWTAKPGKPGEVMMVPKSQATSSTTTNASGVSSDEFDSMLQDAKRGGETGKKWLKEHEGEFTLGQRKKAAGLY